LMLHVPPATQVVEVGGVLPECKSAFRSMMSFTCIMSRIEDAL